jgi:hypothetical protein
MGYQSEFGTIVFHLAGAGEVFLKTMQVALAKTTVRLYSVTCDVTTALFQTERKLWTTKET